MSGETGRIAIPKKALGPLRLFSGHPPAVSAPSRVLAMLPGTPRPAARLSRAPTTAPASAKAPAGKPQARSAIEGEMVQVPVKETNMRILQLTLQPGRLQFDTVTSALMICLQVSLQL